jgi:hypothetical protein
MSDSHSSSTPNPPKDETMIPWGEVISVVVSIVIIILIAVLRHYSDTLTAIAAVAPLKVPLGMWIFMSAQDKTRDDLARFSGEMFLNIIPTVMFLIAAYFVARSGYGLLPTIAAGYLVWGIGLALVFGGKALAGV